MLNDLDHHFIRHGTVALGAITRSLELMGRDRIRIPGEGKGKIITRECDISQTQIHQFGLEHYDKFISGISKYIASTTQLDSLRLGLIAALIIFCIETMQYHFVEAAKIALHGLTLISGFVNTTPRHREATSSVSPAPHIVEDELIHQFRRLELQVSAVMDSKVLVPHVSYRPSKENSRKVPPMPPVFTSTRAAGQHLEGIMSRGYHFMAVVLTGRVRAINFVVEENIENTAILNSLAFYSPRTLLPEPTSVKQETFAAENRRWQGAFEPLFKQSLRNLHDPESLRALLLKIQSVSFAVRLAGSLAVSELIYDKFIPECRTIVSLSKTLLAHPGADEFFGSGTFRLDLGLIYHLATVTHSCRDRILRRQAIALLRGTPWREGNWGTTHVADVAEFIMNTEEEGVESEWLPESARGRISGVDVNSEERTAVVHFARGFGENIVYSCGFMDWSAKPC